MIRIVTMSMARRSIASLLALIMSMAGAVAGAPLARAASPEDAQAADVRDAVPTPPRLSYTSGDVSFWRPGGEDWAPAQVNTPVAPGDQLYTGNGGTLELQLDARSFVRAWGDSQLGLENHEPDFLQLKIAAGHVSLDLRAADGARTVELATPAAAFTIERPGYYRVDVTGDRTAFIARRGGAAVVTMAGTTGDGRSVEIAAGEQVVLAGDGVETLDAPEQDVWDRWNHARTESLVNAASARHVSPAVSGVDDLDRHGTWRVVPEYGSVWVPGGVAADWAPYTTGRWIWDPRFGWTWVDTAPWGWAPYHYGRWVHVDHVWAWAPGPVIAHPAYAPALVAFFGAPGVRVSVGAPFVSWVALGWGEPCVPWWGRPGFVGRPWWGGWGGPRVKVVNVTHVNVYRNVKVRNAVVAVRRDRFGRGPVGEARIRRVDTRRLEPVRGAVDVTPDRSSFSPGRGRGIRPPEQVLGRRVVGTRASATRALRREQDGRGPEPRLVPAPKPGRAGAVGARPAADRSRRPAATPQPPSGEDKVTPRRPPRETRIENGRRPETERPAARREDQPRRPERERAVEPTRRPDPPSVQEKSVQEKPPVREAPRVREAPPVGERPRATEQRRREPQAGPEPSRPPAAAGRPPSPQRVPEVGPPEDRRPAPARGPEIRRGSDAPAPRRGPADSPRRGRRDGAEPRAIERRATPAPRRPAEARQPRRDLERRAPRGGETRPLARPRPAPERGGSRERGPARR